jgi:hypothetical protein
MGNMPRSTNPGGPGPRRDPVSLLFDGQARALLIRVYKLPRNAWAGVRVPPPTLGHITWARAQDIDLLGEDNASTRSGEHMDARTRWLRGMVRALYYQHKWYSDGKGGMRTAKRTAAVPPGPLEVEVGGWLGPRMQGGAIVVPGGHAVRVRLRYGGKTARRVVEAMPESERIWTDDGQEGGRFSVMENRDW